jgi:hypothetical protein
MCETPSLDDWHRYPDTVCSKRIGQFTADTNPPPAARIKKYISYVKSETL